MRLVLLGSGDIGLPTLRRLAQDHDVAAVVSQPDRPAGRKRQLMPTPIAAWAAEQGLPVLKYDDVNDPEAVAAIAHHRADAAVVIAFGQKLGPELIASLGSLAINLHASLLPAYRGAAPINWAMIHGRAETGLTVIGLAQRMDAGLVYAAAATPIDPLETAGELHDRLAEMGPDLIMQVLAEHQAGTLRGERQDESKATRAPKLSKADGVVDWSQDARTIRCRIHGLTPWPGVRDHWQDATGKRHELMLLRVRDDEQPAGTAPPGTVLEGPRIATGRGTLTLLEVQVPGKRAMSFDDFVRGHPQWQGSRLLGDQASRA